ncbi:hypothetical protein IQ235_13250 [Oscillatoriales cyanobacterium LEGE 11467]|uniref:Uncharacterized protein n=1 Tax=Zarconia navalis LEGE 11467 TaxID=1828826 RepID=A0A928W0K8_9CYAN|nr:DUF6714 family protein [Zarconia navalis]MBE9041746.1 hypothetical protein [Zarconia navalis LEGE 11467]
MTGYSALNMQQKQAIAQYLQSLPSLVELDRDDGVGLKRALGNYWGQFLPEEIDSV